MVLTTMRFLSIAVRIVLLVLSILAANARAGSVVAQGDRSACHVDGSPENLSEIREASGVAVSRNAPERLWVHNDSGEPIVFAISQTGKTVGRVRISGATVEDWEAIAVAPCESASCIYIADIGDNEEDREHVTIYRVLEPKESDATVQAGAVFRARYPDGPQDAETLLVSRDGRLFIVTKGSSAPVKIYGFPRELRSGVTLELEKVGGQHPGGKPRVDEQITDGAVSPDGELVLLRTHHRLHFYRAADLFAGNWREERVVDVKDLQEPQGEGVAFATDRLLYLVGEGGGQANPGTLARVRCGN